MSEGQQFAAIAQVEGIHTAIVRQRRELDAVAMIRRIDSRSKIYQLLVFISVLHD